VAAESMNASFAVNFHQKFEIIIDNLHEYIKEKLVL